MQKRCKRNTKVGKVENRSPKEGSIIQATEIIVLLKILISILKVIQENVAYIKFLSKKR